MTIPTVCVAFCDTDKHPPSRVSITLPDLSAKILKWTSWSIHTEFGCCTKNGLIFHHLYFKCAKKELAVCKKTQTIAFPLKKKKKRFILHLLELFKIAECPAFSLTSIDAYQLSAGVQGIRELAHYFATSCSINLFQRRYGTKILYYFRKTLVHWKEKKIMKICAWNLQSLKSTSVRKIIQIIKQTIGACSGIY